MLPLFDDPLPPIDGLIYEPAFLTADEAAGVGEAVRTLPFGDVTFRGVVARRRVVQLGLHYAFGSRRLTPARPLPAFLEPLRARAAALAGVAPADLAETLVTEYQPGAGIGWHRDAPPFGLVVGISLESACVFRFRRYGRAGRAEHTLRLRPGSAYVLRGEARSAWEHSIQPGTELRYSITFRTLREPDRPAENSGSGLSLRER